MIKRYRLIRGISTFYCDRIKLCKEELLQIFKIPKHIDEIFVVACTTATRKSCVTVWKDSYGIIKVDDDKVHTFYRNTRCELHQMLPTIVDRVYVHIEYTTRNKVKTARLKRRAPVKKITEYA